MKGRTMGRIVAAIALAVVALWPAPKARAGAQPQFVNVNIPSTLATISNATTTATTGKAFAIPQGVDLCFIISHSCANSGTSNTVYGFNFSVDGALFTSAPPLSLTVTNNGTNIVTQSFILNRTNFAGFQSGRFDSLSTTETNLLTVLAVQVGNMTP